MNKTSIISALLLAPVLCAQEPQSPIIYTPEGPATVYSETRLFINGKELTPQEVDLLRKVGLKEYLKNNTQKNSPIERDGDKVLIHGHELPEDVAKSVIDNDILPLLQAPVKRTAPAPQEAKVIRPEPVKVIRPEHVKVIRPEPVKVIRPEHVKVVRPEPVKVIRPEHVKVVRPEPKKQDCTCTPQCTCTPTPGKPACCAPAPEQECLTKPAEPNTPVLPTPALDAMPAPAPAGPLAKPCEAKVIINGKEVMVPVDARHIKITIGEDGKPVITH